MELEELQQNIETLKAENEQLKETILKVEKTQNEFKSEYTSKAKHTQKIMPEIVAPAPIDDKYLTIRYERFAPLLVEGIKELRRELKSIKEHLGMK